MSLAGASQIFNLQNNDILAWSASKNVFINKNFGGGSTGSVGSIYPGPSISMNPDPITITGLIDIGASVFMGTKANVGPTGSSGVLDISPSSYTSDFSGLTGSISVINMSANTYSGPVRATVVAGGGNGNAGDKNTLNNVTGSLVSGISHNLSGGTSSSVVTGYNNVVTGGGNCIAGGQQNTITSSGNSAALGIQASISNTERALVAGQGNLISGGVNNAITSGQSNGITNGTRCEVAGYANQISGMAGDTFLRGYSNTFTGGGSADVNILDGYNNNLINSLAHRFNQIYGENFGDRNVVCNNVKALCVGVPSTSFDNGAGRICTPSGLESSGTIVIFGNQVAIGSTAGGEVRSFDKNIRCSVVPATGDDYCNKTYVDSLAGGTYSTTTNVQQIDGPWFNNFTMHCELLSPTIVTLSWRDLFYPCTLNSVLYGFSNPLPVQFRPTSDKVFHVRVQDDGNVNVSGSFRVKTDGYIVIGVNRTDTVTNHLAMEQGFNTPGIETQCGIHAGCITYSTVY